MKIRLEKKRIRLYLTIGIAYLLLWVFVDLISTPETFFKRLWNNIWLISFLVVLNFILFEHTIPFIKLEVKRMLIAPVLLFAHLMLHSFGFFGWRSLGIELNLYFPLQTYASTLKGVEYHMPYSIFSIAFFGIIRYTYDYRALKETAQRLRIEKQEAELNYLRSQTNPHFLFNTLNNIYSLTRDKSDLAPEAILRLSKILRFMLYETSGEHIAIEQEVKIINDYIALESLRYDDSLRVNFNHDIEDMRQAIPPLLLIPLVENAFKHGVSESRSQPFVDVHLSVKSRMLTYIVKNSAEADPGENKARERIGLANLRRQLELLYTDYELSVEPGDAMFTVILKINLSSRV